MKKTALEVEIQALIEQFKKRADLLKGKADSDRHYYKEHGECPKGTFIPKFWVRIDDWESEARTLKEVAEHLAEALRQSEPDTVGRRMLCGPDEGVKDAIKCLEKLTAILRKELERRRESKEELSRVIEEVEKLEGLAGG